MALQVKPYLPILTGQLQTQGMTLHKNPNLISMQWISGEQWQIKQANNNWFWYWQQNQQLQASWKNLQRSLRLLANINSQHGTFIMWEIPKAYQLDFAANMANC